MEIKPKAVKPWRHDVSCRSNFLCQELANNRFLRTPRLSITVSPVVLDTPFSAAKTLSLVVPMNTADT